MVVCATSCHSRSQFGLRARLTGLSGAASRQPTPSRINSRTGITEWLSDTAGIGANGGIGRRGNGGNSARRYHFTFSLALCLDFTPPVMQFIQNNWPLILVMILSGGMLLWPLIGRRFSKVGEVGAVGATQLINRQNAVILDLREDKDYDGGHLPNAGHILF